MHVVFRLKAKLRLISGIFLVKTERKQTPCYFICETNQKEATGMFSGVLSKILPSLSPFAHHFSILPPFQNALGYTFSQSFSSENAKKARPRGSPGSIKAQQPLSRARGLDVNIPCMPALPPLGQDIDSCIRSIYFVAILIAVPVYNYSILSFCL